MKVRLWLRCVLVFVLPVVSGQGLALDVTGRLGLEGSYFWQTPADPQQRDQGVSLLMEPEFYHEWSEGLGDGTDTLLFQPFARYDSVDENRSHIDIRELIWTHARSEWEMRVGIGKVFWGVTESQHLVDVINQTDLLENIDGEDKLGQPMINFTSVRDWGVMDVFVLPGFRERRYPGPSARLRLPLPVADRQSRYTHPDADDHIDLAIRYAHSVGPIDIGLSHFRGTARDPRFELISGGRLRPVYDVIGQSGLDLQATLGDWLLKLEAIRRAPRSGVLDADAGEPDASAQQHRFWAATAGFEYTLGGVFGTRADLGILAEYLYDSRGDLSPTPFEDDMLVGTRWAFNDAQSTELLAGLLFDLDGDARSLNIEASRRIGDSVTLSVELRAFARAEQNDPAAAFSADDHIRIELVKFF